MCLTETLPQLLIRHRCVLVLLQRLGLLLKAHVLRKIEKLLALLKLEDALLQLVDSLCHVAKYFSSMGIHCTVLSSGNT